MYEWMETGRDLKEDVALGIGVTRVDQEGIVDR